MSEEIIHRCEFCNNIIKDYNKKNHKIKSTLIQIYVLLFADFFSTTYEIDVCIACKKEFIKFKKSRKKWGLKELMNNEKK